ncbi:molybdenum cofactor biosynthesis protein MoaA [Burkholderia savannae]|uniref:SMI1/KNR4 family protein n=1 Tax=Burkholderia savannae TaxID=1637837 RepID=UPI000755F31E|nr:SMI1/KNR4 family protein [Burkholderia savannae]AOJ84216.1 molybdenum cofactor biosynthesis protein MoaA [Burkholderia savannae]
MSEHANFPAWLNQAYQWCQRAVPGAMQSETVAIEDALLCVAAADLIAVEDVPSVALAASEGYALRASDTARASRREPVELDFEFTRRVLASRTSSPAARAIGVRRAVDIPAYFPLPENADAIVPKSGHQVTYRGEKSYLRFQAPVPPGHHVIAPGSEYRKGDVLLPKGERITAERQAALIAAGVREIAVTKRPRIGVVIVGYDQVPPGEAREPWQRPDTRGPYIRATLRRWGYDAPSVEYLAPPDMTQPSPDVQRDEYAFKRKLVELSQRYDLIVGAGLPAAPPFQDLGLNAQMMYSTERSSVEIKQTPAGRFNFGRSDDRSPPKRETVALTRPDGTPHGTLALTFYDQATLINLPGHTSAVAMLMHAVVSHVLDLLEHVARPGPDWETGAIAHDVERHAELNGMQWGNLRRGANGEPIVRLLPSQGDGPIRGVAQASVLVAIPAGQAPLPAGSAVQFLRLDRAGPDAAPLGALPAAAPAAQPLPCAAVATASAASAASDAAAASADLRVVWNQLDDWFAADRSRLPGGLNGPAPAGEIDAMQAALGVTLPPAFVESLRIHDGQADAGAVFAENDALLSAREIVAQWSIWKGLVAGGDFDDMTSEPDAGIKDDWYNLKWIPFTHDGGGNHLCLDLDPAEGGTVGQVIRVWHDDERRERVARDFVEWLAHVADERGAR